MDLLTTIILACQISAGAYRYPETVAEIQLKCQKELIKCVKKKSNKNVYGLLLYRQEQYISECIGERR